MNILITGGSGFIGSHLTNFHINKEDHVIVVDNLITGSKKNIESLLSSSNLSFYEAGITTFDLSKLPTVDIIYHLASPASPIQYKKYPVETLLANGLGTYRLMDWIKQGNAKRLVLASTSEVYGDPLIHPQTEDYWGNVNPVGVRACYDEAKRFAEAVATTFHRKYNTDIRIARIFNTYGPNMEKNDGRVVSNFVMQAITNQPITIYGDGTQTRSFSYVSDLVNGLHLLGTTENIAGQIVNLGNPDERNMLELAQIIKKLTNTASEIVYEPISADDPKKRKPDITKAKHLLKWQPVVTLEEGLTKTIAYFKERFL